MTSKDKTRLIVADDSTTIQKVVRLTFERKDIEVKCFDDGAAALEYIRDYGADIVLGDLSLPLLDGYELCRSLRGTEEGSDTPFILLAGMFEPVDDSKVAEAGVNQVLTKPFETSELSKLVEKLLMAPPDSTVFQANEPSVLDYPDGAQPSEKVRPDSGPGPSVQANAGREGAEASGSPADWNQVFDIPTRGVDENVVLDVPPHSQSAPIQPLPCQFLGERKTGSRKGKSSSAAQVDTDKLVNEVLQRLPDHLREMISDIVRDKS